YEMFRAYTVHSAGFNTGVEERPQPRLRDKAGRSSCDFGVPLTHGAQGPEIALYSLFLHCFHRLGARGEMSCDDPLQEAFRPLFCQYPPTPACEVAGARGMHECDVPGAFLFHIAVAQR